MSFPFLEPAYYHYLSTNFFANYLLAIQRHFVGVNADRWTDSRGDLTTRICRVRTDTGPLLRFFRLLFPFPDDTLMSVYRSRGFVHGVNLDWRG